VGFPMVIRRGRRREHPKQHCLLLLRVLCNFQLRTLKGYPEGVKWPSVTPGSHVDTTKKKAREKAGHAQNLLPVMATSGQGLFRSRDFVTSGHVTDVTSCHVTSGHVTLLTWLLVAPPQMRLCSYPYTTYPQSIHSRRAR
jgi:hypothetical protein